MTDPIRISDDQHNNAPAVPQGWKLVPVEPTRAMWAAVNKLDDEMAAGSYDGKGCSIEQAWNCMLDFAPDAPALAATQAPAPAQEVGLTDDEIDENTVWHDPDPHDNVHCDVSATVRKCLAALRAKGGK